MKHGWMAGLLSIKWLNCVSSGHDIINSNAHWCTFPEPLAGCCLCLCPCLVHSPTFRYTNKLIIIMNPMRSCSVRSSVCLSLQWDALDDRVVHIICGSYRKSLINRSVLCVIKKEPNWQQPQSTTNVSEKRASSWAALNQLDANDRSIHLILLNNIIVWLINSRAVQLFPPWSLCCPW